MFFNGKKYNTRVEKDSLGNVSVPEELYFGSQTQRCLDNFKIGTLKMPIQVYHSFAHVKKACAEASIANKDIKKEIGEKIVKTGSGTQTNMNVNEVISNRATELMGGKRGEKLVHPNDHVNKGQSSNDTFPTAMHVSSAIMIKDKLLPALDYIRKTLSDKQEEFKNVVKCGRTHTMDAVPLTLGQEFSAFVKQIDFSIARVKDVLKRVHLLTIGGTAVGTGLNTRQDFGVDVSKLIAKYTGIPFQSLSNKFEGLSSNDTMVELSGVLNTIACSLMKIANDIRFLSSGPRMGIGEIIIPSNEPGSSIMPGKINPTQCEAVTMVCCQVMGNNTTVSIAGSNGHFQLNVFKPVIIYNVLQSIDLISDSCVNFSKKCIVGIKPNHEIIKKHLESSLMLVTALNPHIGYDKAGEVAKKAYKENISLKESAKKLGYLTEKDFDKFVQPKNMIQGVLDFMVKMIIGRLKGEF